MENISIKNANNKIKELWLILQLEEQFIICLQNYFKYI